MNDSEEGLVWLNSGKIPIWMELIWNWIAFLGLKYNPSVFSPIVYAYVLSKLFIDQEQARHHINE